MVSVRKLTNLTVTYGIIRNKMNGSKQSHCESGYTGNFGHPLVPRYLDHRGSYITLPP